MTKRPFYIRSEGKVSVSGTGRIEVKNEAGELLAVIEPTADALERIGHACLHASKDRRWRNV
ncbi:hypothetical protein [Roseovarius sp. SYSU LYC5161]|uniref:hypothetical protein n=1 Tax=Roseovarius halophilus (ex Wu et al. 2025) TaxID=3376060 RepID=UPI00399B540D